MASLVDRLNRLAAEAARLAQELAAQDDVVQQLLAALSRRGMAVTHAGHRMFEEIGVRFAGPAAFEIEELVVRSADRRIEFDYQGAMSWFALFKRVKVDHDVLLGLDLEMDPAVTLNAFVRSQQPGRYVDGATSTSGGGALALNRLLPCPEPVGPEARNFVYLVFNQVAAPIALRSLIFGEVPGDRRGAPDPAADDV